MSTENREKNRESKGRTAKINDKQGYSENVILPQIILSHSKLLAANTLLSPCVDLF